MRKTVGRAGAIIALTVVGVLLAGCSTPPWEMQQSSAAAEPGQGAGEATSTAEATPTVDVISNDLSAGTTLRSLEAGAATLSVQYWSTLNMSEWYADVNKPVTVKVIAKMPAKQKQNVYLYRVSAMITVSGADGPIGSTMQVDDTSSVNPGYLIKSPYSYDQTFIIPPVSKDARQVTMSLTFEVLIPAAPGSKNYAKQTASDTLKIAIAGAP